MSTNKIIQALGSAAGGAGGAGLNVEEVFSTYLYDGTSANRDIVNDIDLSTEGGAVWFKGRSSAYNHILYDTERGVKEVLRPNRTDANSQLFGTNGLTAFNTNGFSITGGNGELNYSGQNYASWTFRKAPKFFDVVTYTGNGVAGREIAHNLGATPGMIIVKKTSGTANWYVWHRSKSSNNGFLNTTDQINYTAYVYNPTSTGFNVFAAETNVNGDTYVAYLFAHNDGDGEFGPDGDADIIKCGSYAGNATSVDLGFEPQFIMVKRTDAAENWMMFDSMRGWNADGDSLGWLMPNSSAAESTLTNGNFGLTSTGFKMSSGYTPLNNGSASSTYIYIAIRRGPMAVPESATDVFDVVADTTTFSPSNTMGGILADWMFGRARTATSGINWFQSSRLSPKTMPFNATGAEQATQYVGFDRQTGIEWENTWTNTSGTYASWYWKRAPSFFDVVAYSGNSTSGRTVSHNLGVAPEMMWVKTRSNTYNWMVYHTATGNTKALTLDGSGTGYTGANWWNNTSPSSTEFTVGNDAGTNYSGRTYIAYLFASLDGVSKVGSVSLTIGPTTKNVDCGFSNGARFVLMKRYSATGSWLLWDAERGIVSSGNDPYLLLNTTDAEVGTADFLEPYSQGFTIRETNFLSGDYLFYAIA